MSLLVCESLLHLPWSSRSLVWSSLVQRLHLLLRRLPSSSLVLWSSSLVLWSSSLVLLSSSFAVFELLDRALVALLGVLELALERHQAICGAALGRTARAPRPPRRTPRLLESDA